MLEAIGSGVLNALILAATAVTIGAVIAVERRNRQPAGQPAGRSMAQDAPLAPAAPSPGAVVSRIRDLAVPDRISKSPTLSALTLVAGLLLVTTGQSAMLVSDPGPFAYLPWLAGLLVIAALAGTIERHGGAWTEPRVRVRSSPRRLSRTNGALATLVAIASVILWREARDQAIDAAVPGLIVLWLLSIAAVILLATGLPHRSDLAGTVTWLNRHRLDLAILGIITLLALIPRFFDLSSYPWPMSGDEGTFGVTARSASEGEITNPFNSGPWGYPSLLFILQGIPISLFGDSVAAARTLSALLGIGSVMAVYLLGRHHFGRGTGFAAAVLVSAFHFHLFWSRDAQNAAAPMLFIPLALLFLDRGLVGRGRVDALIAGLVIGFGQFFHPADRILFPIAIVYAGYAVLTPLPGSRRVLQAQLRAVIPNAAWVALGAIISHLPLVSYYWNHRTEFWTRTDEVSVFASGWLERERELTGDGSFTILLRQLINAALLPFNTLPRGHFRPEPPFVGWPLVIPLAIGLAIVTLFFWKRRYFGLALAFWATVAGLALTDGPPQTNRYTAAAPFLAFFGALGIAIVARIAMQLVRLRRSVVIPIAAAVVVLIATWHLHYYFRDPNQITVYSDTNTQVTHRLARQAEALDTELTVYFGGPPRIFYGGFRNLPYIAPNATGIDIEEPLTPDMTPPVLSETTLFAFLPERRAELDVVMSWFPGGELEDHTLDNGTPLYSSYLLDRGRNEPGDS